MKRNILRKWRKSHTPTLTLYAAAKELGVTWHAYRGWERGFDRMDGGVIPNHETIARIAAVTGIDDCEILDDAERAKRARKAARNSKTRQA